MNPQEIDEHSLRLWGAWAALAFGTLMLGRAFLDFRRNGNPLALRVGLFLVAIGIVAMLAAVFRWW